MLKHNGLEVIVRGIINHMMKNHEQSLGVKRNRHFWNNIPTPHARVQLRVILPSYSSPPIDKTRLFCDAPQCYHCCRFSVRGQRSGHHEGTLAAPHFVSLGLQAGQHAVPADAFQEGKFSADQTLPAEEERTLALPLGAQTAIRFIASVARIPGICVAVHFFVK